MPTRYPKPRSDCPCAAKGRLRLIIGGALVLVAVAFALLAPGSEADAQTTRAVPTSQGEITLSFAPIVRTAAPAVVNIYTRKRVAARQRLPFFNDPFFQRFFGDNFFNSVPRERVEGSLGSGVILNADGLVVTNNHVIEGADEIRVVLNDRREFAAEVIGTDEGTDLAVLRVDPGGEPLPTIPIHDSDLIEVGDLVLAIGNPFGVGQTVTSGIVSAQARTGVGRSDFRVFIQTDAAINPGNSGGALVDMRGGLIGINTVIFSRGGGSDGVGFAIPSSMVRAVVASITGTGRVVRAWMGVTTQAVDTDIAASLGLRRPVGVLISDLHRASPALAAGVRQGDVVLSVDGHDVDSPEALRYRVATKAIGDTALFTVLRAGRERDLAVNMMAPPEDPPRDQRRIDGPNPFAGAQVANLSPALVQELALGRADRQEGVVITAIRRGSNAHRLGFRPGDVIVAVNGQQIDLVRTLSVSLDPAGGGWDVVLKRGDRTLRQRIRG